MSVENLNHFFNPKSIAVIGASDREESIGGKILRNLVGQYNGIVYPINPFRRTVNGITAFPTVERLPSKTDLAIVAIPAHSIPQVIEECGKTDLKNIVIVSAGFDKNITEGKDLNQKILELRKAYNLRIIGPNSYGIIRPKNNLYATFGDKRAIPGKIAFISQSAALCGLVLDWSQENQVGLSAVVSTGYSIDVNISDLVDYFGKDSQTRTIMLYFEDLKNIRSFMSAARGYSRTKPIVLVKVGAYAKDRQSSSSSNHINFDEDKIFDAAFRRAGVVRVDTVTQLLACGSTLSMQPKPNENCLTIVTNANGLGIMAVDKLNAKGGELWKPSRKSEDVLKNILPYYCNITNPIDVLEEASPERLRKVLQACHDDPTVKSLLLIYTSLGIIDPQMMGKIIIETAAEKRKTFLAVIIGEDKNCREARMLLNRNGIPAFETLEEAVSTFMHMYMYTKNLELLYQTPEELQLTSEVPEHLRGIIRRAFNEGRRSLSYPEALSFLNAYQIPTVKSLVAQNAEQAKNLADEIGFPVSIKDLSPQSLFEPVKQRFSYDADSISEVETSCKKILEKNRDSTFATEFQGILIQHKPEKEGLNLFAGSRRSPKFGSIILFGIDGTGKTHRPPSIGFPPLNQVLAKQIIENSDFMRYIGVSRNDQNGRSGAVEETLVKLSQLIIDFPEVMEINLDPLVLDDEGVHVSYAHIVIDRERVLRESSDHHEHLVISPYPKKYVTVRTLKNGLQVRLRPIKPEDEKRFNEFFISLSEESVRFRFFETIRELSHDTLTRYCNLDYDREIAIIAEFQDDKKIIGVVRIIPDLAGKTGEFAIMVGDKWQGQGLGSKLMDVISDVAKDLKLQKIHSQVSRANTKMIRMCTNKGFEVEPIDEYVINMSKELLR